jgi:hypothetical protein
MLEKENISVQFSEHINLSIIPGFALSLIHKYEKKSREVVSCQLCLYLGPCVEARQLLCTQKAVHQ